jgi:cellulose synthase/poly-beta-1,6-N-acetylglucosamine synthase-like glycosyltransferase
MIWLVIATGMAFLYAVLQFQYIYHWKKIPAHLPPQSLLTPVSIILVVRNEEQHIEKAIQGILHQHYPAHLFEVILIDDHSTDGTLDRVKKITDTRLRVIPLSQYPEYVHAPSHKKSAITLGVYLAHHEHIIVTDGDCFHGPAWLKTHVQQIDQTQSVFQTAPVQLVPQRGLLYKMQEVEMVALMLITGAGIQSGLHQMANGANMMFTKSAFKKVNGYAGNEQFASGDDMFLIEKMKAAFPDRISFVKSPEATVYTYGCPDWSSLLKQRLRWAGKNKGLKNPAIGLIWFFIGAYHLLTLLTIVLAITGYTSWLPAFTLLSLKWVSDYFLLLSASIFFKRESLLRYFLPLQFLYGVYVIALGLAMLLRQRGDWDVRG